jgi:hypothetical protein
MPKKHIANHFAEWMKRIGERLSDLESNYKDLDSGWVGQPTVGSSLVKWS